MIKMSNRLFPKGTEAEPTVPERNGGRTACSRRERRLNRLFPKGTEAELPHPRLGECSRAHALFQSPWITPTLKNRDGAP